MLLIGAHAEFWRQRKAPEARRQRKAAPPKWAVDLDEMDRFRGATVDRVVNDHADVKATDCEIDAGDAIAVLRDARARNSREVIDCLQRMVVDPDYPRTVTNPARRAGYCRKWLARIRKEAHL